jgi:3-hydroxyisobutyrate dehydrogenase-like beta-hydroxyacid dehydrogenase
MSSDQQVIGFIGLGAMGAPMANNLLKAGYALRVYNRTAEKARPLVEHGAGQVQQPAAVAAQGGILITMLSDDQGLEEVVFGERGILGKLGTGGIHLSMSTVSPTLASQLADEHRAKGEHYVAATVFGRPEAAAAAKLWICTSGDASARERVRPVLEVLGQGTFDFGDDPAAAHVVKLAGNFMIAAAMECMAEAFTLAEKNGIERSAVHELLSTTLFACPIYQNYGAKIAQHKYEPAGFRLPLGLKDISLVLQRARESGAPMPLASLLHDRLLASVAKGRTELDWAGLARDVSEAAGL